MGLQDSLNPADYAGVHLIPGYLTGRPAAECPGTAAVLTSLPAFRLFNFLLSKAEIIISARLLLLYTTRLF